ncbi:DUF559 domain-containing protein [Patescibacteria group bacterium]|nr:DUF559 domain-containing protein [Patescibacteria group bacterium]MBU1663061.1 DUF559 domain-containing protein [Patescibacteria group bacterium]MBU1934237.1 DUF559 domain-containing protein [Patescibacteria group bacterium]
MQYKYLPYNKKFKERSRKMRNEMTVAEKKLWYDYLRQNKYRWLRQKPIGNFIVDFYCSKLKLVIEIDGETHIDKKDVSYDQQRTKELEKLGLKVLRFWNDDILNGLGEVENIIEGKSPYPLYQGGKIKYGF